MIGQTELSGLFPWIQAMRRDFHKYAEAGWLEMRTSSRIARELKLMGLDPIMGPDVCAADARMGLPDDETLARHYSWAEEHGGDPEYLPFTKGGFTGVIAEIKNGTGPVIALRFDIDALGVSECEDSSHRPTAEGFASITPGVMHSCGHDGHAAIGLAVARLLLDHRDELRGTVRLIFQPAEEGVRGARSIAAAGWLADVDFLLGSHIVPRGPSGAQIAMIADGGPIGLATAKYDIEFFGKAAHAGTSPHEGRNALLSAATAVVEMHAIPRFGDALTRINVGKMTAGTGRNVICDRALLEMEVRGETSEACSYMEDHAIRIAEHAASMHGCTVKFLEMGSAPVLRNSADLQQIVTAVCKELDLSIVTADRSEGSSEDFSHLSDAVLAHGGQSFYFGFTSPCSAPNHDVRFDFEESVLGTAAVALGNVVLRLM